MSVQLTVEQAAFLQGPVSINVAAAGRDGWPQVCRAQGCVIARDRRTVTLLLSARRGRELLDALDAGSGIAAVFSRPSTHATLQLKAVRAERVTLNAALRADNGRYAQAFADELVGLGFGAELGQNLTTVMTSNDLTALRFAPEIVFDQTPGPAAGRVLATT
ncbi:MAG: hypothetical protein HY018_05515 [Hydrogenophilales bacterium]|nr:hypothetical protein [Hydrogenophilales bacterium]